MRKGFFFLDCNVTQVYLQLCNRSLGTGNKLPKARGSVIPYDFYREKSCLSRMGTHKIHLAVNQTQASPFPCLSQWPITGHSRLHLQGAPFAGNRAWHSPAIISPAAGLGFFGWTQAILPTLEPSKPTHKSIHTQKSFWSLVSKCFHSVHLSRTWIPWCTITQLSSNFSPSL